MNVHSLQTQVRLLEDTNKVNILPCISSISSLFWLCGFKARDKSIRIKHQLSIHKGVLYACECYVAHKTRQAVDLHVIKTPKCQISLRCTMQLFGFNTRPFKIQKPDLHISSYLQISAKVPVLEWQNKLFYFVYAQGLLSTAPHWGFFVFLVNI